MKVFKFFIILLLVSTWLYAQQKDSLLTEEEKVKFEGNYLPPSPSEVLNALHNVTEVDWKHIASYNKNSIYPKEYLPALNLGVRIADGFVAVQAQDKESLGDMATVIEKLGKKLSVSEALLDKRSAIEDSARQGKWQQVRQILENLRGDVENEINRLKKSDLATLVGIGGWLEGLRVVSKALTDNYDEEASTMLYQPKLIEYYIGRLDTLSGEAKEVAVVKKIIGEMDQIKELCIVGRGKPVPKNSIEKLNKISSELVEAIERR